MISSPVLRTSLPGLRPSPRFRSPSTALLALATLIIPLHAQDTPAKNKGLSWLFQKNNQSAAAPAIASRSSEYRGVYFIDSTSGPTGGTMPLAARIQPNSSKRPAVAIMEEFSGGLGDMSKSACWVAALVACNVTGQQFTDYEFTFRSFGFVDGPSAGMLNTVAIIALLRGDTLRPDTTITGTISPDGTCGPVGGIEYKMTGASKEGIKRFGYPRGARLKPSQSTGQFSDLRAIGESLNVETREIDNVYEAYEWMTGKKLETPPSIDPETLSFPPNLASKITAYLNSQLAELKEINSKLPSDKAIADALRKDPNILPAEIVASFQARTNLIQQADNLLNEGELAAATITLTQAATACRIAQGSWFFNRNNFSTPDEHSSDRLKSVKLKLDAAKGEINATNELNDPNRFANNLAASLAFSEANGFYLAAVREQLKSKALSDILLTQTSASNAEKAQIFEALLASHNRINLYLSRAETKARLSTGIFLAADQTAKGEILEDKVGIEAKTFASAGSAMLANFEALHISNIAKNTGATLASVKQNYAQMDPVYTAIQNAETLIRLDVLGRAEPDNTLGINKETNKLASALFCYLGSSILTAKNYNLEASVTNNGQLSLQSRSALGLMLDSARNNLLQKAEQLHQVTGSTPHAVRTNFQIGEAFRVRREDQDQLNALAAYWQAINICEMTLASLKSEP